MSIKTITPTINASAVNVAGETLIATITPSGATAISFTNIPQLYKHLKIVFNNVYQSSTTDGWGIRLNSDATASRHVYSTRGISVSLIQGDRTNTTFFSASNQTRLIVPGTTNLSSTYDAMGRGTFTIYRYTESAGKFCEWVTNGDVWTVVGHGNYESTSPITQIDFIRSGSQTVTGVFHLYGIA